MSVFTAKQILPGVNLSYIHTHKFKTSCISVNLLAKLDKNTAAKNALLPNVLRRGTASYPDTLSIAAKLDKLYGARIEPVIRKKGEVQAFGFYADFIDDDFVPDGEDILENVAELLGEMLLAPKTRGGQLLQDYVESERSNLIDEINAEINDKRQYSVKRLIELMCADEAYGISKLGSEKDIKKITAAGLTKHYRNVLGTSPVEIIYCGSADEARVERAIKNALASMPRGEINYNIETDIVTDIHGNSVRKFTDNLDVTQGKLAIGFRLGEVMMVPNYAALSVFNAVFGGSATSKLFLNVREKLALCYFASSMTEKHKGVMIVSSGIEFDKKDEALKEIFAQLDDIREGNVEQWEIDSARKAVINSLKSVMDQPYRIEDYFFDQTLSDLKCMPEDLAALAGDVTVEDIQKIACSVKVDSIYFLEGKKEENNEK